MIQIIAKKIEIYIVISKQGLNASSASNLSRTIAGTTTKDLQGYFQG